MSDPVTTARVSFANQPRVRAIAGVAVLALAALVVWGVLTAGRETTDDAQVDAHITPVAARVSGTIGRVPVVDNQLVEAGAVLAALDPRDYQVAVDKARAELADAEGAAAAAASDVPVTSTRATGNVATARGGIAQAQGGVSAAEREIEMSRARLTTAQAHLREADAVATKAARDAERLRGLLAKDEVSQQQFDATVASADAQKAAAESARSQIVEAEAGIRLAESRLTQARAGEQQARAVLSTAETGPEQVAAIKAREQAARAHVEQAKATLAQAELNLQYATVTSPVRGIVSRKTAEVGQIVQAGQPLMAVIPLDSVWVTANFKETQLTAIRPGQRTTVKVDAYGGREFTGHVESIAAATGSRFSMLPPENATGNYVKVVQRVPVKIVLDAGQGAENQLRPGMSVVPTVYTK